MCTKFRKSPKYKTLWKSVQWFYVRTDWYCRLHIRILQHLVANTSKIGCVFVWSIALFTYAARKFDFGIRVIFLHANWACFVTCLHLFQSVSSCRCWPSNQRALWTENCRCALCSDSFVPRISLAGREMAGGAYVGCYEERINLNQNVLCDAFVGSVNTYVCYVFCFLV